MIESVRSGACGPCGSTAPTGRRSTGTGPESSIARARGDVRSAKWIDDGMLMTAHSRRSTLYSCAPTYMRIAVVGGGPGGLYFAALARQLDPHADITVWERNAADDTFGFGVVFSDETLGGIEHADPVIHHAMSREFARWDDIDIHFKGQVITSGGHGFAAMSRGGCSRSSRSDAWRSASRCDSTPRRHPVDTLSAEYDLVVGIGRCELGDASAVCGIVRTAAGRAPLQVHVARHRPRLRRVQVLHRRNAVTASCRSTATRSTPPGARSSSR